MKALAALSIIGFPLALLQCSPDAAPVTAVPDVTVDAATVAVADPPYIADAAGVPTAVPPIVPGETGTTITGRCTQWSDLAFYFAPPGGWDIDRISRYEWRESRCDPTVRSRTHDSGLLQLNDINLPYLRQALGEWVDRYTLLDPVQNVRAAAALCTYWRNAGRSCYRPWGGR